MQKRISKNDLNDISDEIHFNRIWDLESEDRHIGWVSGSALIVGTIIGSGVFTAPVLILSLVHSVGMTIVIYTLASIIAIFGTMAYVEFGCLYPVSGGEKEYLEIAFPSSKSLLSFIFTQCMIFLIRPGFCSTESIFFGQNIAFAAFGNQDEISNPFIVKYYEWIVKFMASLCIISLTALHSIFPRLGMAVQDGISVMKAILLLMIIIIGIVCSFTTIVPPTTNFRNSFVNTSSDVHNYATALFSALYAFDGWNNLNYCMDELIDPIKSLPKAALGGIALTSFLFIASLISHFVVIPVDKIDLKSTIITCQFFTISMGDFIGSKIIPILIGLSSLGCAMCMSFGNSRVIYLSAKQGDLWDIFAYSSKRKAPVGALFLNCVLSLIMIILPPQGEIYQFLLSITTYPEWIFYLLTVVGVMRLRWTQPDINRPFKSFTVFNAVFVIVAILLIVLPFVKPKESSDALLPYYLGPLIGCFYIHYLAGWFFYYKRNN